MLDDIFHQPHDKFFKAVFSTVQVAEAHLSAFLPPAIVEHLRLGEMVLDTTAYVSKRFKHFQSDVVWSVPYKNGKVKIVILYEHKTTYDRYIHVQVLRYMIEIWEYHLKKDKKDKKDNLKKGKLSLSEPKTDKLLDIIIPVVVYQGVDGWEQIPFQDVFTVQDADLLRFLPVFDYILNKTTSASEAHLQKAKDLSAYIAYRTMRQVAIDALSTTELVVFLQEITALIDEIVDDNDLGSRVYTYIFGNSDADAADVMAKIHISNQQKKNNMSILQQLYTQGETKGISLGKAEGKAEAIRRMVEKAIRHGKLTDAEIADYNDTSLEYVQEVRTIIQQMPPVA